METQILRSSDGRRPEKTVRYFAYGSNMDVQQMRERGARFADRRRAVLKGYILKFNKRASGPRAKKGEGKGNIEPDPAGAWNTEGALYTITKEGLERLDSNEGYPEHYARKEIVVHLDDGSEVMAWVYVAQLSMIKDGLKPTREYLSRYLKGYDLLSREYYRWLEKTETLD